MEQMTDAEYVGNGGNLSRDELIELLTADWLLGIDNSGILSLLTHGHKGYDNMSYSELLKEVTDAELIDQED